MNRNLRNLNKFLTVGDLVLIVSGDNSVGEVAFICSILQEENKFLVQVSVDQFVVEMNRVINIKKLNELMNVFDSMLDLFVKDECKKNLDFYIDKKEYYKFYTLLKKFKALDYWMFKEIRS